MCGIAGAVSFPPGRIIDHERLARINGRMQRRGPDHAGFWYSTSRQVGLAHNRLAIIDPHQRSDEPMEYLNGRYVISYNGEIYNYKTLREELKQRGHRFTTNSDTEVIMAMYDCYGVSMLDRLRGMYAFAIWDSKKNKLFAARDPFGIKPLYYFKNKDEFLFASQVSALSAGINVSLAPSAPGWYGFLKFGSVPEPFTIYEQIQSLPAGSYLELGLDGKPSVHRYFCIYEEYARIEERPASAPDYGALEQALAETVEQHLVADVPIGLFLSAGLDSNVIAWYARNADLVAFTLDFREFGEYFNESALASKAAKTYGFEHRVMEYGRTEAESMLEEFFKAMDQPSIDGLNIWMISKVVSDAGYKTVLSGLGGDEVLAGYPSFVDVPRYDKMLTAIRSIAPAAACMDNLLGTKLFNTRTHPKIRGFFQPGRDSFLDAYYLKRNLFLDSELDTYFEPNFISEGRHGLSRTEDKMVKGLKKLTNPYLMVSALEIDNYMKNQLLRDSDWASMYHSLEVRVPFVDRELIGVCAGELARIKAPDKPAVIRKIMGERLPEFVLARAKSGFETPVKSWLNTIESVQHWKSQKLLANTNCPWSRRWAYEIKTRFF